MNQILDEITAEYSELGQSFRYDSHYNPERLFPISRAVKSEEIGLDPNHLPGGLDINPYRSTEKEIQKGLNRGFVRQ